MHFGEELNAALSRREDIFPILMQEVHDAEICRFRFLEFTQYCRKKFNRTSLFPYLSNLQRFYAALDSFQARHESSRSYWSKELERIDLEGYELLYSEEKHPIPEIDTILSTWNEVKPQFIRTIGEGSTISSALDNKLWVEWLGMIPGNKDGRDAGIFFIPQRPSGKRSRDVLHLYSYSVALSKGRNGEANHSLRTRRQATFSLSSRLEAVGKAREVKMHLVRNNWYSSNPQNALVCLVNDGYDELPFHETLLPLAKRNLLYGVVHNSIHSHGRQ